MIQFRTRAVVSSYMLIILIIGSTSAPPRVQGQYDLAVPANPMDIPADKLREIEEAVPVDAVVKPKKLRKLLVFNLHITDGTVRQGHRSIPYANNALKIMGERTGAYEAVFSSDTLIFVREKLAQFDAICFNNTVGVLFNDPEKRSALLEYVWSGGGFVGIHAAGATFVQWPVYDQWPEFGVMLGGYENGGHPWKPDEWITLKVDEMDHPLNSAFSEPNFDVMDEVFQFQEPYSRDKLRVLLSIDTARTDMSEERRILPERRADGDLAISWVRRYGRGRVFYTSLGHNPHINWNPKILEHMLAGIQFAAGDLDAPVLPSNCATPAVRAQEWLGWRLGVSGASFEDKTLFETVEQTSDIGIHYLGAVDNQLVSSGIAKKFDYELADADLVEIRRKLDAHNVTLVTYSIEKMPNIWDDCNKMFDFARKMGIEVLVGEPAPESMDMIEKLCDQYDMSFAVYSRGGEKSPYSGHPGDLVKYLQNKSSRIGLCGDFSRWLRSGINPVDAAEIIGDRLLTVLINDVDEKKPDGHSVPLGMGESEPEKFCRCCIERGIKPRLFSIEYREKSANFLTEFVMSAEYFNDVCVELAQSR
jgi:type 1 glutamine amidotransferase/sugar phosphate isomerase/epimerase